MLFAVAIQLAAEVVFGANEAARYVRIFPHGYDGRTASEWWEGPRLAAYIERDVGATLIGLGYAVAVEVCWRVWRRLRNDRQLIEGAA
jgi:hypothetical protein